MAQAAKTKTATKRSATKRNLVIVESPSKAKTIGKFLGSRYKVVASVGHVRDLPKSKLGIDKDNDFEPLYINIRGKGDVIKDLKKEAKNAAKVFLATDPDREGEAISWHIAYILGLPEDEENRIEFNEITKEAIKKAIAVPRKIDMKLVDAQQARRVLDRLVGYEISPLLWRKIRRGLSAGRVQSAALKIIIDREREILAFVPEEFWNITAYLNKEGDKKTFPAKLLEKNGEKYTAKNGDEAKAVLDALEKGEYKVSRVEKKERVRKPSAPFTTSSLQQDASVRLGFQTRRTMSVAQQLYEGIDIKGRGTVGLISYIRTDSVRISAEAEAMAKDYILANYTESYLGNNVYSNKKKEIQDAHEAIRPSYVELAPDEIKDSLTPDQYKLYSLIWSRFLASRMKPAVFDAVSADVVNGEYLFRATGSKLKFDGFLRVYNTKLAEDDDKMLPDIIEGETLMLDDIASEQSFTQPPPRFTEASLVKELEEKDIGRPSTYVPIISTLTDRRYVTREKKTLKPMELGFTVTELIENYFKEIADAGFTSRMEDRLDDIEANGIEWHRIISDFYKTLAAELEVADREIEKIEIEDEPTDEVCELCGKPMVIKHGRFGKFMACSGYPDCKNTKPIVVSTGVACPLCGKDIVGRKSRKGKTFYGCSGYPDCKQVYWYKPVNRKCPTCGALLVERNTKEHKYACSNPECKYRGNDD
ncbi:MAG: type I DNA topoisomerase [Clostridiales Family XIII bacterium]|jgi:DNA topoisomerase-1|nr:type I DNA topoisomerase [Clostridiales Family XIII bacterium]